jgi:hypothetical protein
MQGLRTLAKGMLMMLAPLLSLTCTKVKTDGKDSALPVHYFKGGISDKVTFISKCSDGGFIYCGYTGSDSARTDAFVLKVSSEGKEEWYRTYGGKGYDEFRQVIQLSDGSYLAVGQTNSMGKAAVDISVKISDYIVKISGTGEPVWSKSFSTYTSVLNASFECPDHSILVTGSNTITNINVVLMKLDQSGNLLFSRYYSDYTAVKPFHINNTYNVFARCVALDEKGKIIICGVMSKSYLASEVSMLVPFLIRASYINGVAEYFNPYYDYVNSYSYLSLFPSGHTRRNEMRFMLRKDGYLIGTYFENPDKKIQIQLIKTDFGSNILWEKEYSALGNALFFTMEPLPDETILIGGASTRDAMSNSGYPEVFSNLKSAIIKINDNGDLIWSAFQGSETSPTAIRAIQPQPDGTISAAGYSCSNETGYDKMFWMKLNNKGELK